MMRKAATLNLVDLMSASLHAGRIAAGVVRAVMESKVDLQVKDKSSSLEAMDPQTIADLRSQEVIVGSIKKAFPGLRLVGEEGDIPVNADAIKDLDTCLLDEYRTELESKVDCTLEQDDLCIWIDPLDGTKEFVSGFLDAVTVLIGVSYRGSAIGGVIVQPFGQQLQVWGIRGAGAFGYQRRSDIPRGRRALATSRSHHCAAVDNLVAAIQPTKHLRVGGAGGKVLLVLQGEVDAYVHPRAGTKKWDSCAGDAVVHAAGGTVTDIRGQPLRYQWDGDYGNNDGVVVTLTDTDSGGLRHQDLLAK